MAERPLPPQPGRAGGRGPGGRRDRSRPALHRQPGAPAAAIEGRREDPLVHRRALRELLPAGGRDRPAEAARRRRPGALPVPALQLPRGRGVLGPLDSRRAGPARARLVDARAGLPRLRRVPADDQAHAPRLRLAQHLALPPGALRASAEDRLREDGEVRHRPGAGAALEEPPRLVRLHRVRPLQRRVPGPRDRQAAHADEGAARRQGEPARPQRDGHPEVPGPEGPPAPGEGRGRGGVRAEDAPRLEARDRPLEAGCRASGRRLPAGGRAGPRGRALGVHDLRRLRPGVPGPHRLRPGRPHRPAAEPRDDGVRLPAGGHDRVQGHGGAGQPLGRRAGTAAWSGRRGSTSR